MRRARRFFTEKSLTAARAVTPFLPDSSIRTMQWFLSRGAAHAPVLRQLVKSNMQSAGVWRVGLASAYFDQVANHLASALRMLRFENRPAEAAELVREQIDVDSSIDHLRAVLHNGKGAVVAAPHVCNYVLTLARLNMEVPICVYLRWSKNERKRDLKHAWCRAAGLPVILEPPDHANPASRAAACVDALRDGRALVMTPDIAQKDDDKGLPVRLLKGQAILPAGPAAIAMLAEVPIVPVFGMLQGRQHVICAHEPITVRSRTRAEGGRFAATQEAMQHWADHFDSFVRRWPEAWFLWADSRWTRVFQHDPRFGGAAAITPASQDTHIGEELA